MLGKETTANVLFSKDINKKHNKKWVDGIATFINTSSPNRFRFILRDEQGNKVDDSYYKPSDNDGLLPEIGSEQRIGKFIISMVSFNDNQDEPLNSNEETNSDFITEINPSTTNRISNNRISNNNEKIEDSENELSAFSRPVSTRPLRKVGLSRKGIKPLNLYSTPPVKPENNFSNNSESDKYSRSENVNNRSNSFVPPRQLNPTNNNLHSKSPSIQNRPNYPNAFPNLPILSTFRRLRDKPRTFEEIIKFYTIFEEDINENQNQNSITPEVSISYENENRQTTIGINNNDFLPESNFNNNDNNDQNCKQNPVNVLADALSSDNESLSSIIRNNEFEDSDDYFVEKEISTTGTDEPDSIINSEVSSLASSAPQSALQQPFKPPTEISPVNNDLSNNNPVTMNSSECLKQEIGLLWGLPLKSIGKRPPRIPIQFNSIDEYKHYFIQGIVFEMNSKIIDVYTLYQAALFTACNKNPMCKMHNVKMNFFINSYNGSYYYACTKPGCKNRQSVPPDAMMVDLEENESGDGCRINKTVRNKAAIESFMKKKHVAYHDSRLFRTKDNQVYLMFNSDKDENIEYTKDDVWVIFSERLKPFFVISESYGVYSNTKIEIGPFFNNILSSIPQQLKVTAIRVFNAQSERQAIINLLSLTEEQMPIIPVLLSGVTMPSYLTTKDPAIFTQSQNNPTDTEDGEYIDPSYKKEEKSDESLSLSNDTDHQNNNVDIQKIADDICENFHLNEDQRAALFKVAEFFNDENQPMLLVHGLFGAGKSKLLSVIAIFLDTVLTALGRSDKILVAASTNVAVDNVLSNLFEFDHINFTRVGSVKKIRRSLLPFVTGHGTEESISELSSIMHDTLQTSPNSKRRRGRNLNNADDDDSNYYESHEIGSKRLSAEAEKRIVQEALQNAQNEMKKKVSKIDTCRIVGVTCAACSFAVMAGRVFPFVLLDECSQQTEPISLIPMSFGCRCLICCGDPKQLPPTLAREASEGYGRPLFTRMMTMVQPIMLSIQYRCHPRIADICSYAFYGGKVKNGITEEDRAPIFQMPTLCVFNVTCGEEMMKGGSTYNTSEAIVVVNLVRYLINVGVSPEEIGVIAFYKAQVEQISIPLSEGSRHPIVDVSTVDAFQGDEREVIIISTAKTKQSSFVDSPNRINVAISRAKRHLFFVTKVNTLMKLEKWNFVINRAGNKPNISINLSAPPAANWAPFGLNNE